MPRETTITRTLMCRDHEAATFSYDPVARRVVGRPVVHDPAYLPLGCLDQSGRFAAPRLRAWLANRAVPATRPGLAPVLQRLGLETPEELLAAGLGLSLSDQYWLRPPDADLAWSDVSYFERPFSPTLGAALAPHDPDSGSEALEAAGRDGIVIASSPDSALNGFADEAVGVREMTPAIAGIPGRLKGVRAAIEKNVAEVRAMRR